MLNNTFNIPNKLERIEISENIGMLGTEDTVTMLEPEQVQKAFTYTLQLAVNNFWWPMAQLNMLKTLTAREIVAARSFMESKDDFFREHILTVNYKTKLQSDIPLAVRFNVPFIPLSIWTSILFQPTESGSR